MAISNALVPSEATLTAVGFQDDFDFGNSRVVRSGPRHCGGAPATNPAGENFSSASPARFCGHAARRSRSRPSSQLVTRFQLARFWSTNSTSLILKDRNRPPRRVLEPTGAARLAPAYRTQFSTFSAGTRLNSLRLSVTQTASIARACAAISMSWAPIGVPFLSSATRIAA